MKELLLLRHAKSSWKDETLPDHDRPLSGRGRRAAAAMAEEMADRGLLPDRVLCSTAKRTRETWALMQKLLLRDGVEVGYFEDLYLASPRTILQRIRESSGESSRILVIGHDPGMHDLASALPRPGSSDLLKKLDRKFPTGALAHFRLRVDRWREFTTNAVDLVDFVRPKDLPDAEKRRL